MARNSSKIVRLLLVLATGLLSPSSGNTQDVPPENAPESVGEPIANCEQSLASVALKEALRPVCARTHTNENVPAQTVIIVGFVGGFVKHDDPKHPEVIFARLLNKSYPATVHAEVFANHEGNQALHEVLNLLNGDKNGVITASEKEHANVIIYGHSWGASQVVALARALEHYEIPVLLTIQVDSVRKPGQEDSTIPPNVKKAVNFYQTRGPIHGRSMIRASDPAKTSILGNFQMAYRNRRIKCDNYPWFPRHFNEPHHEIENDPQVWDQVASLIDSELFSNRSSGDP